RGQADAQPRLQDNERGPDPGREPRQRVPHRALRDDGLERGGDAVKAIVILATLFMTVCGSDSTPSAPNFVVVSTDWRSTLVQAAQPPSKPAVYAHAAHGVFRNQGASGSAVVTFSDQPGLLQQQQPHLCSTVVRAAAGQVVEASCPMPEVSDTQSPPIAKVSQ